MTAKKTSAEKTPAKSHAKKRPSALGAFAVKAPTTPAAAPPTPRDAGDTRHVQVRLTPQQFRNVRTYAVANDLKLQELFIAAIRARFKSEGLEFD